MMGDATRSDLESSPQGTAKVFKKCPMAGRVDEAEQGGGAEEGRNDGEQRCAEEYLSPSEVEVHETTPLVPTSEEPKDSYNANYLVLYLLGMATLLPWNFFISVNSFWDYKFRDINGTNDAADNTGDDDEGQTELQEEFTSYLAIASNVPNAIFVILNAIYGQRVPLKVRMFGSLSAVIVLFFIVLAFTRANSDQWQQEFLYLMLSLVVIINCWTAIFQGALFGVAGKFPPSYMGAVMAGQAMGGIFPAVVDICFTSIDVTAKDIGFSCFLIATIVLLASFFSFSWARRTSFFQYHSNAHIISRTESDISAWHMLRARMTVCEVLLTTWHYCLAQFLVFTTTLAVFPAVTVLVESQNKDHDNPDAWSSRYFTPVTCFLLFNCGDYLGRLLATKICKPGRSRIGRGVTLALSIVRIIFIPLFLFCNAAPTKRSLPVIFSSDAVYIVFMVVFSVSNGYLGSLCMLHGPKLFASSGDQELTAMVLIACIVLGTSVGSFLSYPLVNIL